MVVNNRKYGITCRSQGNLNLAFCSLLTYQKVKKSYLAMRRKTKDKHDKTNIMRD